MLTIYYRWNQRDSTHVPMFLFMNKYWTFKLNDVLDYKRLRLAREWAIEINLNKVVWLKVRLTYFCSGLWQIRSDKCFICLDRKLFDYRVLNESRLFKLKTINRSIDVAARIFSRHSQISVLILFHLALIEIVHFSHFFVYSDKSRFESCAANNVF